ncbi:MAG TPA: glycosyltransferase family 2 protein [Acidimicrobiia bacterium]|nr:glycosyltransferase family 2 protein [Acidimicrobiia bacterium]
MAETVLLWINYGMLGYVLVMELQILLLAGASYVALRRDNFTRRHGRIRDLATSDTTPPITIIIPAHNEQAGIVESVRSTAMLHYPRLEIVVVNDGSTDLTVQRLVEAFDMVPIDFPFRPAISTKPIRRIYRSRMPLPLVLVDKEGGGKSDAINAGINVSQYPYFMATDADMIIESEALIHAARHFVEDRDRTVAVGGNVRPLNGSRVRSGSVSEVDLPRRPIEMVQIVEYIRSFLATRPGWSAFGSLLIVSGAFGMFRKSAVIEVGGFRNDHLGEDMEMTMRLHRHYLKKRQPYRIVYAPDAVAWTEVPSTWGILRKQRIRWHRGLIQVIWQYKGMIFNPRYRRVGLIGWPVFIIFEFIAPTVELLGWVIVPASIASGFVQAAVALPLAIAALLLGAINSVVSLFLDDRFGYFGKAGQTLRLLFYSLAEHIGLRQMSVWWRFRAMFWNRSRKVWGDMQRTGVGNLAGSPGEEIGTA